MPAARPAIINDRFEVIPQGAAIGAEIRGGRLIEADRSADFC
jgi:hypothetical protein